MKISSLSPSHCPLSCGTVRWCTSPPYTSDSAQRLVPAEGSCTTVNTILKSTLVCVIQRRRIPLLSLLSASFRKGRADLDYVYMDANMTILTQACYPCWGVHAYIFPAQCSVTVFTVDVGHSMKSCEQQPLLRRTTADVHPETERSVVKQQLISDSQRWDNGRV